MSDNVKWIIMVIFAWFLSWNCGFYYGLYDGLTIANNDYEKVKENVYIEKNTDSTEEITGIEITKKRTIE